MRGRARAERAAMTIAGAVLIALFVQVGVAEAQTFARRLVPRGDVTGLEMGIEGSLSATPGDRIRWFVTVYEVLQRRDLRPVANATLEVTASFSTAPLSTVVTDARGRAALEIPIPEDFEDRAEVRVAATAGSVRRVFSVDIQGRSRHELSLFVDRNDPAVGSTVAVFGRVVDRVSGLPAAGQRVTISATSATSANSWSPLMAPRELTSDASGVFGTDVSVGDDGSALQIQATTEHGTAALSVEVSAATPPLLWVTAEPETRVASPGDDVPVAVRVRRADGRPVRGARVSFADTPVDRDHPASRTRADGRVRLSWRVSSSSEGAYHNQTRNLTVLHPGIGSMEVPVRLRVVRARVLSTFAIEGGALVPELSGRVYVRLVAPDGTSVAARAVTLDAKRLGGTIASTTDADGVAVFEATVAGRSESDACGGPTATEATLIVGAQRERLCLPVDPDGMIALRVDDSHVGAEINTRVERRPSVRSAAVEVTALSRQDGRWTPVAQVVVGSAETRAALTPPPEVRGEIWLRARPLLPDARAIRGGGLVVYRGPTETRLGLAANERAVRVTGANEDTVVVYAVRHQHETSLEAAVREHVGPIAMALAHGQSPSYVRALLAARTPNDAAATAVMRDREVVPQPLPTDPVAEGLLRDPFRTRARFVRGRLGRLMSAVESYADECVPDQIGEVAVRVNGRWRFNHTVLHAAAANAGLGDEMVAALDGEPLDIDALTGFDGAFSFDNVARRITRERLFRVLVMLRDHVRYHGLDVPWARRGDPREYLATLLDGGDFSMDYPERSHLFDGWGTPFALRPARGGRARFDFLTPVEGWELVSAGPDGLLGTGDDVVDPFARVLPTSGIYAEAVGEDILLARLGGVALGRATVESLSAVFEIQVMDIESTDGVAVHDSWHALPGPPPPSSQEARLSPMLSPIGGVGETRSWTLPPERRRYAAVGVRFGRDGSIETVRDELEAGAPWAVRLALPTAMRPGEALRVPITLIQLADAPRPSIEVVARGGALRVRLEGDTLSLDAVRPGMTRLTVRVRDGDREVETLTERIRVVPSGSLRARHSGTVASPEAELHVHVPDDATPLRAHLVLGAPRAIYRDPIFAPVGERHPAILAWGEMQSGGEVDAERLASVTRAYRTGTGTDVLSLATALVVWAAQDDAEVQSLLASATATLVRDVGTDLSTRAAILAALSSSVVGGAESGGDQLSELLAQLRLDGWRALSTAPDRPAVMARMAAALLLADRRDVPGRGLLARARAEFEEDEAGRRWVPGEDGQTGDGFIGTLAVAIAARQVGDDALADELAANVMGRLYLVERLGAEGAFWMLAASVYGVFGVDAPHEVRVRVDGQERQVSLVDGAAVISLAPGAVATVASDRPVWARTESRYVVPFRASDNGELTSRLEGAPGRFGERAGYELVVRNSSDEPARAPVVELTLPGAARLDRVARTAIESAPGVARLDEPDGAGVVRITLEALVAGAVHRVPLPFAWIARGTTHGLSMQTYDAHTPWDIRSTEGRTLDIGGGRR